MYLGMIIVILISVENIIKNHTCQKKKKMKFFSSKTRQILTFLEKLTLARCQGRWVDPDSLSKLEKNERWSCNHLQTPADVFKCNETEVKIFWD